MRKTPSKQRRTLRTKGLVYIGALTVVFAGSLQIASHLSDASPARDGVVAKRLPQSQNDSLKDTMKELCESKRIDDPEFIKELVAKSNWALKPEDVEALRQKCPKSLSQMSLRELSCTAWYSLRLVNAMRKGDARASAQIVDELDRGACS